MWVAEQIHPVRRTVAVKFVKSGIDSETIKSRFEAERQALALMDHPNIAKLLDAGATIDGRPFLVMEYVKGVPITNFCDQATLKIQERLQLFITICHAVQHLHHKSIAHRDLKPSNVLVTLDDSRPFVKVIDFGIAKATGQQLVDKTLFTPFTQVLGTPLYMSPEQISHGGVGIDTRCDIYALGALLYELLIGTTPFDAKDFADKPPDEIFRVIREEEPQLPSARLNGSSDLAMIAANRGVEPNRLLRVIRGELDWVIVKCLEKDRNRRYDTPSALADDLQRYLNDEHVQACPPSAGYKVRKFMRRNKTVAVAAFIVAVVLIAGMVATSWGLISAERARQRESLRADAEKSAKHQALEREAEKEVALSFLSDRILMAARPKGEAGGLGHDVMLRSAIEAALPELQKSFRDQPLVEARLRMVIGESFWSLGEDKIAEEQFETARNIRLERLGAEHIDTIESSSRLIECWVDLGRYSDALRLCTQTLEQQRKVFGPDDTGVLHGTYFLADIYNELGRRGDALSLCEQTFKSQKARLGPEHPDVLVTQQLLAAIYYELGRYDEAVMVGEQIVGVLKARFGPDNDRVLMAKSTLADFYAGLGRHSKSLVLREETLAVQKARLGDDHATVLENMFQIADEYDALGRQSDALRLCDQALAILKVKYGTDHPSTLAGMQRLAASYVAVNRPTEAIKLDEVALAKLRIKLGSDHPSTIACIHNLANSYSEIGRSGEAIKLREEAVATQMARFGPANMDTLVGMQNLASDYESVGRRDNALKVREETLAVMKRSLGPQHPEALKCMCDLANAYDAAGRRSDSIKMHEEILTLQQVGLGVAHPHTLSTMDCLADRYADCGRLGEAIKLRTEELAVKKAKFGTSRRDTFATADKLAANYLVVGKQVEAVKLLEVTVDQMKKVLGPDASDTLASMQLLALAYATVGREAEGVKLGEATLASQNQSLAKATAPRCKRCQPWHIATMRSAG